MHRLLIQMLYGVNLFVFAGFALADSLSDAQRASDTGNYTKAVELLRPLAAKGNAVAQFKLAAMYYSGKGVPRDNKEAVRLYRLSAEQGNAVAQSNLATMYFKGEGVPKDFVLAHMWKNLAIANAEGDRQFRYLEQLKGLEKEMTAKERDEALKLAKKCTANRFKGCTRKR